MLLNFAWVFAASCGTTILITHTIALIWWLDPIWTIIISEIVGPICGIGFAMWTCYYNFVVKRKVLGGQKV